MTLLHPCRGSVGRSLRGLRAARVLIRLVPPTAVQVGMPRLSPCCAHSTRVTPAAVSHCLVAALTHSELGVSYDEACDLLEDVPVTTLRDFEQRLCEELGQEVVGSSREVTVFDTRDASLTDNEWLRSIHFNDRLDLVQSCIRVHVSPSTGERVPDHSRPPPSAGRTATHLFALAAAPALHHLLTSSGGVGQVPPRASPTRPLAIVVLGAGGCSVPAFLATALRLPGGRAFEVSAVELSSAVVAAARAHFGIAQLEANGALQLYRACASEHLAQIAATRPGSVDVLLIDLESGLAMEHGLRAPPSFVLDAAFLASISSSLSTDGVVALNCIAPAEGLLHVEAIVTAALGGSARGWWLDTGIKASADQAVLMHRVLLIHRAGVEQGVREQIGISSRTLARTMAKLGLGADGSLTPSFSLRQL